MEILKIKNGFILILLVVSLLGITINVRGPATLKDINLVEIGYMEFESSHWFPQKLVGENEMLIETKQGRNVEDEYYNAALTIQNQGHSLRKLNATILLKYSGIIVERELTIGDWDQDRTAKITLSYLPAPEIMKWEGSEVMIDWEGKSFDKVVTQNQKVDIRIKTNDDSIAVSLTTKNEISSEDDHDPSPITPLSIRHNPNEVKPQTHVGDVIDMWEGSSSGSSSYNKGSGPSAKVVVKFNSAVNGFYIEYTFIGTSHTSWIASYTQYWGGSFGSGSTWVFTLNFGWTMEDAKYVFGQGSFYLSYVQAYGSNPTSWIDGLSSHGSNDEFTFTVPSGKGIAFRFVIDDGKTVSTSGRSLSNIFDDANGKFDNHQGVYDFDIEIYQVYKTDDWAESEKGWDGPMYFLDYMSSISTIDLFDNIREGFQYHTGVLWTDDSKTSASNRGYDLLYGISGAYRKNVLSGIGAAPEDSNLSFNFAGKGYYCDVPFCWRLYDIGSNLWDNIVQHETSHNYDVDDHNSGSHIMNAEPKIYDVRFFLLYDSWINWRTTDQQTLYINENRYGNAL